MVETTSVGLSSWVFCAKLAALLPGKMAPDDVLAALRVLLEDELAANRSRIGIGARPVAVPAPPQRRPQT